MSKSPHEECQTGIAIEREGEYPPTLVLIPGPTNLFPPPLLYSWCCNNRFGLAFGELSASAC